MKQVYAGYQERLGISYRQFARLVSNYQNQTGGGVKAKGPSIPKASSSDRHTTPDASASSPKSQKREPLLIKSDPEPTLHFDPIEGLSKEFD